MITNQDLVANAIEAINKVFGDVRVSREQTLDHLELLRDEIDVRISALEWDEDDEDSENGDGYGEDDVG